MAFSKYNRGRPFLLITQHLKPAEGENPSMKDFGKLGKKNLQEMVSIIDRVKDRHLSEATIIIDILKRKIVKKRYAEPDAEVLTHYLSQYKDQIAEGVQIWMGGQYKNEEEAKTFMDALENEIETMEKLNDIKLDVVAEDKDSVANEK